MNIKSTLEMNNGVEIPRFGLGMYLTGSGTEARNAVSYALEAGYRHIDTAAIYGNEKDVGISVKSSNVPREDIFVTTKVWNSEHGFQKTMDAFEKSLEKLDMDYVDLYLIHWPVENLRNETWKALEHIYESGKARSIGVSNFTIKHLEELLDDVKIAPVVNQIEFSPFLNQKELKNYCESKDIYIQAYSPLVRGKRKTDARLTGIATKNSKTWAQVLIRWALQNSMIVIPKSSQKQRILENADVFDFELSEEDMNFLNTFNRDYRVSWNPSKIV